MSVVLKITLPEISFNLILLSIFLLLVSIKQTKQNKKKRNFKMGVNYKEFFLSFLVV